MALYPNDVVSFEFPPSPTSSSSSSSSLSIDIDESSEAKIERLIADHPVIIFSRSSCFMCHVMKNLFAAIGVNPTVIELDADEISAVPFSSLRPDRTAPAVFIGGTGFGGLDTLFALHLSGNLVPKLLQIGALPGRHVDG